MLDKEIADKIGLTKYLKNGVIDTPDQCVKLCIDVGLSETAPNSGTWFANDPHRCVIGIEPLEYCWERLRGKHDEGKDYTVGYPAVRIDPCEVHIANKKIIDIPNRFYGLQCAVDNILFPQEKTFYHMVNEGGSSLLKPSDKHDSEIKKLEKVQCVSLKDILDHVDWKKFKVIEHLKIDCEGHDLEVIKSAEKYLDRIVFITFEMSQHNKGHWEGHYDFEEANHYMQHKGFNPVRYDHGDIVYINRKLSEDAIRPGWRRHVTENTNVRTSIPLIVNAELGTIFYCDVLGE
jgi:FkbM family methyltransferase